VLEEARLLYCFRYRAWSGNFCVMAKYCRVFFIVLLTYESSRVARACSCFEVAPACSEVWSTDVSAVFLGTAGSVEEAAFFKMPDGRIEPAPNTIVGIAQIRFAVQETYKGPSSKTLLVRTSSSECGFRFREGEQYLVYADKQDGQLYTNICQRTRLARSAAADLEYLRQLKTMPATSRIFGSYTGRAPGEGQQEEIPMTGETITVAGAKGQIFTAKVDAKGEFSLDSLPPGRYAMRRARLPSSPHHGLGCQQCWMEQFL
jgi:hypothetical protein